MDDTHPQVRARLTALYRAMPPEEKWRRVEALIRDAQALALAGIRDRHPDADERECFLRLAALRLGRDLMIHAYGWDPNLHGE